jgi:uncharacterized RDD family membrane protein YckC
MDDASTTGAPPAGPARRLAALVYDGILLLALLFVATLAVLPLSGGEAITTAAQGPAAYLYRAYLALLAGVYFGWSWTRTGQTLGMRSWRIRLVGGDGTPPRWPSAALRFSFGCALMLAAGSGIWLAREPGWSARDLAAAVLLLPAIANFAWSAFDPNGRSLQDIACRSRVVRVA